MKKLLLLSSLLFLSCLVKAQVDQNFKVKGTTDCNEVGLVYSSMKNAEEEIHGSSFNIQEEMNTSRPSGYRKAHYRSCNMRDGYLLLLVDQEWIIHREVPLEVWTEYYKSRDLEGYYLENIKGKYPLVTTPI